jgi:hypothetical protein
MLLFLYRYLFLRPFLVYPLVCAYVSFYQISKLETAISLSQRFQISPAVPQTEGNKLEVVWTVEIKEDGRYPCYPGIKENKYLIQKHS